MKIETILQQDKIDKSIQGQVILYKGEAFTFYDCGLTRHVFVNDSKTKVIKILIDKDSIDYNRQEIEIYTKASPELKAQMAKTQSEYDGYVVEQEFCEPIKFNDRELTIQQIMFATSCRNEVGWNKDGQLVCFDLDEFKKY